ncbi:diguanylate cyclase domain-containing protein [Peribacillus sp. SCS-155]|uniref:sensor domain-containing diguanylate cyclase n=1 Tax=Peribacillus sedimenti TaxID=3115297 RepID=UPI003905AA70
MVHLTTNTLYDLKTLFLNHMDFKSGQIKYDSFINNLLAGIKEILSVKEVALFRSDFWKRTFYLEASTCPKSCQNTIPFEDIYTGIDNAGVKAFYYNSFPLGGLEQYNLILPLRYNNELAGILAIQEQVEGSLSAFAPTEGERLARECADLLEAASSIANIVNQERRYKQLFRVTEKFHSSMSMNAVLGEIIETLEEVYPTFTYYLLISHDNKYNDGLPIKDMEYDSDNAAAMQAYVTGNVQFEDLTFEKKSILYAPLKGKQGVYGVLQVIAGDAVIFPKGEVEFITLLANTAGSALENAQLYEQSRRLISDLQMINETSNRLNSSLPLSETMAYMQNQITDSFGAQETGFIMFLPNGGTETLPGSTPFFHTDEAYKYIDWIKDKISREKDSLFIGDLNMPCQQKSAYSSLMAVPMIQSNSIKGFAVVLHEEKYFFSFDMFKLLQSLIHHSSLALSNSMLREELEKMVITDHLTRLYSRNYLDEKIFQSMQEDAEGTFILIDIDDFKKVNDTYGHQVGDEILVQVASLITKNIRDADIGARWGGEELAIYLPRVSLQVGVSIAERLIQKVAELPDPKVTISCGVSYWKKDQADNAKALFKRADQALYQAKNSGKNKVLVQN